MDGTRFDDLSRSLAHGITRRTAVKGVIGGLLGALGLRKAAGAQVSQAQCGNTSCRNNPGKCADGCVCCVYGNGNSRCRPPGTCNPGTERCPEGEAPDPELGCVPTVDCTTAPEGAQCDVGKVCVDGACTGNGVCGPGSDGNQGDCGNIACAQDSDGDTTCRKTVEGGEACLGDVRCSEAQVCETSSDCPAGAVCRDATGCSDELRRCRPVCTGLPDSEAQLRVESVPAEPSDDDEG